ncbi:MAG: PKD domain-containing protein [Gammaproteobacteria bacterium]
MRITVTRYRNALGALLSLLAVTACGFVDSGGSQGVSIDPRNRIENEQTRVVLDATVLVEAPEGKTFSWTQVEGPPVQLTGASTARASFVTPAVERRTVLVFTLTATDEFGASESQNITVTINDTPTANAGADRSGRPGTRITLNGGASVDSDGTLTFAWRQTVGPSVSLSGADAPAPSFTVPAARAGTALSFRLIVTDDNGATASDTVTVSVLAPPPPVDPGPVDPGPVDPGPVDPGPVDPGPVDPGPVDPGPVDPGPGPVVPPPDNGDDDDDDGDGDDGGDDNGDDDDFPGIFDGFLGESAGRNLSAPGARKFAAARVANNGACWLAARGRRVTGVLPAIPGASSNRVLYRLATNGRLGSAVIADATTGRFTYTPNAATTGGTDRFTYRVVGAFSQPRAARIVYQPRIMPLGGALTAGSMDAAGQFPPPAHRVGYRRPLSLLLASEGYHVDFVGSRSFGFGIDGFDAGTQAHAGWSATEIAYGQRGDGSDGVYAWLTQHPADIVLLQLEANHLAAGPAGVEAILDEIYRWAASPGGRPVSVVLSGIVHPAPGGADIRAFNSALDALVARRVAGGVNRPHDIIVVDAQRALTAPADFQHGAYLSPAGYRKLAGVWRDALTENNLLRKCP